MSLDEAGHAEAIVAQVQLDAVRQILRAISDSPFDQAGVLRWLPGIHPFEHVSRRCRAPKMEPFAAPIRTFPVNAG